jgi:glycosyltransferase involved in cell wall biosynthesis
MSERIKITFILPTKNEELTVGDLIQEIKVLSKKNNWISEVIVVDDSSDQTEIVALKYGADVFKGHNKGLGYSMLLGLSKALCRNSDWVVSLDTDGQVVVSEIPFFIQKATTDGIDVLISSRFLSRGLIKYVYPNINWFGNRILVFILRLSTGFKFTDSHGGIRLMRPWALDGLSLIGRHTYVQETLIHFIRNKLIVKEMPSQWNQRTSGDSRILKSILKYIYRTLPGLLYLMRIHYLLIFLSFGLLIASIVYKKSIYSILSTICIVLAAGLIFKYLKRTRIEDFR